MSSPTGPTSAPQSGTHDNQADFREDMRILEGIEDEAPPSSEEDEAPLPNEGEEDATPRPKPEEEEEEEEHEESDEEEETPPTEEEKEQPTQLRPHRPTVREINSKYPNFFKDFPDMRHMLFREAEYTNLFPTVDDAKEASTRAQDFDKFSELVTSGKAEDFQEFLKGVKEVGEDTLTNMAANFLPSLYNADRDMYYKVTSPIGESILRNAYRTALSSGDENLKNASLHLAQWAFGDMRYATGELKSEPIGAKAAPKDEKLEKEKQEFYQTKYNDLRQTVNTTAAMRLRAEVKRGLDPNGVFNDFTAELLVDRIMNEVGATLEKDDRHMKVMNSLWKNAHRAGFAGNWKDRLLTTYLSGARAIMPAIRAGIRNSALNDQRDRAGERTRVADKSANRKDVPGSGNVPRREVGSQDTRLSPKSVDYSKTSDMDILNDRVTFKK